MAKPIITREIVRDLLNYDPETGIFTYRHRDRKYCASDASHKAWNTKYAGKIAGGFHSCGYITIRIFGCYFLAHRLAFLYMTGSFPSMGVDHIDRNKSNNRFKNLRIVSGAVNKQNMVNPRSGSTTKILGAHQGYGKKFTSQIGANNKRYHLGTFNTAEEAGAAYQSAKKRLHPDAVQTLDTA